MKPKYPDTKEVKDLLSKAEALRNLSDEFSRICTQVSEVQRKCRELISRHLGIADDPNVSLDKLLPKYRRERRDNDIDRLLSENDNLVTTGNAKHDAKKAAFEPLKARVVEIGKQIAALKQGEYDALVDEIEEKLAPYCSGIDGQARWLAQQCEKAVALYSAAASCRLVIYGTGDLVSPIRAILRAIS